MKNVIDNMSKGNEVFFCCNKQKNGEILTQQDIDDAWERIKRFSKYVKAAFPETEIYVDSLCCAGTTPENHQNALNAMRICQIHILD